MAAHESADNIARARRRITDGKDILAGQVMVLAA